MPLIACSTCKKQFNSPPATQTLQLTMGMLATSLVHVHQDVKCPHCTQDFRQVLHSIDAHGRCIFAIVPVDPKNGVATLPEKKPAIILPGKFRS